MASLSDFAGAASVRVADWLALVAAPTFAIMGVLTMVFESGAPVVLCAAMPGAAPMNGMAAMYLLMSVFHLAPWLRLAAGLSSSTSA
jgi:hypothetical protein